MVEGIEGLLRDKTRKPGKPPLAPATVQRVVDLTLGPPRGEATRWTGRELAKVAGVSLRWVQRILEAHQFATPDSDVQAVEGPGICRQAQGHRPAHAVVLSVDEKRRLKVKRVSPNSATPLAAVVNPETQSRAV